MARTAVLICFNIDSEKFESNYERNKFFRGLYGWKQTVRIERKKYIYHRDGLLDEMKFMKIDQSSFVIEPEEFQKIMSFFKGWHEKVIWKKFEILLEEDMKKFFEEDEDG